MEKIKAKTMKCPCRHSDVEEYQTANKKDGLWHVKNR